MRVKSINLKILNEVSLRGPAAGRSNLETKGLLRVFRLIAMTVSVFYFAVCLPAFAADEHQAIADFMRGSELYKQAKYSEAIAAYEKALEDGYESGELYYNLGNAYYRDGQTGRAALNYERARQLIPRDRDLKFNHRYLLSRHPEAVSDQPKNFIERAIDKHTDFYTQDEMVIILFVLFVVLGLAWIAAFHWQWQRSTIVAASLLTVTVMCIYGVGLMFELADVRGKAVAVQKMSAHFEPRAQATEHFQMPEGAVIKVLKEEDGWAKIQRPDKKTGWVPENSIEKVVK